jgi:hypothetical protein
MGPCTRNHKVKKFRKAKLQTRTPLPRRAVTDCHACSMGSRKRGKGAREKIGRGHEMPPPLFIILWQNGDNDYG